MRNSFLVIFSILTFILILGSCEKEEAKGDLSDIPYNPIALNIDLPANFPKLESPADNPLTVEGAKLGRFLFYDPILSGDSTMSCSSCHQPHKNFRDDVPFSIGIAGLPSKRSSMTLVNVAFSRNGLFWDGRSPSLEDQAIHPVSDPIELNADWPTVISKLQNHPTYPEMFRKAFGINKKQEINRDLVAKALAQFQRTIISKDSKFDRVMRGEESFTDLELIGFEMFMDDNPDLPDAECAHCHNVPLMTSDDYFNNGLLGATNINDFTDKGRGGVTGAGVDFGSFKAPTLRNVMISGPYMHNGSLKTIDEVLDHYISGGHPSPTRNSLMRDLANSGLNDPFYKDALKAFLHTLTDTDVLTRKELQNPFE